MAASKPIHGANEEVASPRPVDGTAIRLQLERVLSSSPFLHSKRYPRFLRFVVEQSVKDNVDYLKERVLGIEVFDRPPNYDLTTDPIVRVAAGEIRKRLAQYYVQPGCEDELRIELQPGTYAPEFHWPVQARKRDQKSPDPYFEMSTAVQSPESPPVEPERRTLPLRAAVIAVRYRWAFLACSISFALLAIAYFFYSGQSLSEKRALEAFWAPVMDGNETILICAGDLNAIMDEHPIANDTWRHVTQTQNHLDPNVGAALLRLGRVLGAKGMRATLKLADLTQLSDLREQPVIFIGGFNNSWTQRILSDLRFQMRSEPDPNAGIKGRFGAIIDTKSSGQPPWIIDYDVPVESIKHDYALITRLQDPLTGQPVVLLSGLGSYGNSLASEFVSKPDYFWQFANSAPTSWKKRTVQIVLETEVVDGRVSVPRVVASQVY